MRPLSVTQTVILAAGYGSRLGSAESGVPKPLMTVAGVPLIAHAIEHARASGCVDAVIVIGYQGARVQAAVEEMAPAMGVRFVENRDVSVPNGLSLLAAERLAAHCFYLQMVDHVFAGVALPKLAAQAFGDGELGRVLIDRAPGAIDLADATKVRLMGSRVTAIGKSIEPWDAVDAGCFVLTPAVFDALRRVPSGEPLTVSSGMRQLVASGALGAADVDGVEWIDVDTPADRAMAERLRGFSASACAPSSRRDIRRRV
jgi:1L-myo-inositol 1-phosphate cytidylyltransferase